MSEVLVTGGAGFLGSHLAHHIEENYDKNVISVDDLSGGFESNISDKVEFIKGSVTDQKFIEKLFREFDIDIVYHLAAYAAEGLSHFIRRFNYRNNLIGSANLINESVKNDVDCFVFTSSIAVYGEAQVPMSVDQVPQPEDPYGIAKYAVEMDLEQAHDMFGLDYVVFRPHNVYGEYQNIGDKYRNVVGIFMNQILKGEPMTIFGDGTQKRAFTYVDDVVSPIAQAPWTDGSRNRVFNVGADTPHSVNRLAAKVAEAMGVPDHPVEHLEARNEVEVAYSDHSGLREVFGEQEETPLDVGLQKMADWVREVGARSTPPFEGVEIEKNLPPSWADHIGID
ncbi:NAD-dependent epimerase/dehydratase family protein [Salinibacter ruber]|uniref:NAD-dependent epimerase/dehydratase family protein n=1 Tax=Salinibacter ruber TaxID=146919 RepID=UPI000C9F4348|nr:NAD-dependent epimerase/dehydratase family protein [Salinibacter ruber]